MRTGAGNVVPGSVEVDFNFRFSTESSDASLRQRVEALLKKHGLEYRIDWTLGAKPFLSKRGRLADICSRRANGIPDRTATLDTGGTSRRALHHRHPVPRSSRWGRST